MDFLLNVDGINHASLATNIFDLKHLNIQNSHRMVIMVSGKASELIAITKRVNELGVCTIKFLGLVDHDPYKAGRDTKFHYSLTGTKAYLQSIRDALGLEGVDPVEPIYDFDEDESILVEEILKLSLGLAAEGASSKAMAE